MLCSVSQENKQRTLLSEIKKKKKSVLGGDKSW